MSSRIVASIRGTASALDAMRDLIINPSPLYGGMVHSGMRDEADEVITKLKPLIDKTLLHYPNYGVVFTGHSLGAGAASIATLILQTSYQHLNAYCFACPSCVSADLLPRLSSSVISVTNMHDAVPRMNSSAMHKAYDAISSADWLQVATRFFPGISGGECSMEGLKAAFEKLSSSDWSDRLKGCCCVDSVVDLVREGLRSITKENGKAIASDCANSKVARDDASRIENEVRRNIANDDVSSNRTDEKRMSNNITSDHNDNITNDIHINNITNNAIALPSNEKTSFSWNSFLAEYNALNNSLSLAFNFMHAYNSFYEQEKRILDDYHNSVDKLLDTYRHNVKERGTILKDRNAEQLDPSRVSSSVPNALEETSGAELAEYSAKQASLLIHHLTSRTASLEGELQETRQRLLDSLQPLKKPLLPAIPSAAATAESFSDFLMVLKQVFSKKEEKGDWFPYPQLYPPGVILHIRNNPTMKNLDDYEVLEEAKKRLDGKTWDRVVSDTQLVEVDKEEFDHYSLESSLAEDHRMGNYVWGLMRVIDRKQFEESVNSFVCWSHNHCDVEVFSRGEVTVGVVYDDKDALIHISYSVVLLCGLLQLFVFL